MIILSLLFGERETQEIAQRQNEVYHSIGFVVTALMLMILFRKKYPRWWFDWNRSLAAFMTRVMSYLFLLRDEYPSTDEEQAVHLSMEYPDAEKDLTRWMPLVKWLLAIPHVIVLFALDGLLLVAVFFSWVAIIFTGRNPRGLFNFVEGVMRWNLRVLAYAIFMVTDRYPPFSLYE